MSLNDEQARFLNMMINNVRNERNELKAKLTKELESGNVGTLAHFMEWNAASIMSTDLHLSLLMMTREGLETGMTIGDAIDDMVQQIIRWSPRKSTCPVTNLTDEYKQAARQEVLKVLTATRAL